MSTGALPQTPLRELAALPWLFSSRMEILWTLVNYVPSSWNPGYGPVRESRGAYIVPQVINSTRNLGLMFEQFGRSPLFQASP